MTDLTLEDVPPMMQEAMANLQNNDIQNACILFEQVLKIVPEEFDALHILGVLKHRQGDLIQAEALIQKAIAINPDFADAHYNLAKALQDQNRHDDATRSYKTALALNPDMDVAHYNLGLIHSAQKNWPEAFTSFKQAVRINPQDTDYLFNLANVHTYLQQYEKAIACYLKLVDLDPSQHIAYNNLGIACRQQGQLEQAIAAYQQAISVCPSYADAYFNLGNAYEETRQLEPAKLSYQNAIAHNPDMAKAYNNLGNVCYMLKDFDQAQNAYEKTVALNPASSFSRHMLNALTGVASESAPAQYIEALFDKAADDFEERLVDDLQYNSPQELKAELLKRSGSAPQFKNALDLGCGTGLSGAEFRSMTKRLEGVDISSKIVTLAEQKKIYDALTVGEIMDYLKQSTTDYDLFIAADVLAYFGNLAPLFESIQKRSAANAYFLFTVENTEEEDYLLRKTGRFSHSKKYIQSLAEAHQFTLEACKPTTIRMENDSPISGFNFILRSQ